MLVIVIIDFQSDKLKALTQTIQILTPILIDVDCISNRYSSVISNVTSQKHAFGAIVLMGVSGCGKSTVGRLVATDLDCIFIEGDTLHDAHSIDKMRSGIALNDEDRWPWLERLGKAIGDALAIHGSVVVSCSALKKAYRDRLARHVDAPIAFILLEVSRERLLERLEDRAHHFMPATLLDSQLSTLERPTQAERALTLNGESPSSELRSHIRQWLQQDY